MATSVTRRRKSGFKLPKKPASIQDRRARQSQSLGEPEIQDFKGHPVLVFEPNSRYPQSIGLKKLRLILENLEAVEAFVESEGQSL